MYLVKKMEFNIDTTQIQLLNAPANKIFVSKKSKMTNINCRSQLHVYMTERNKTY